MPETGQAVETRCCLVWTIEMKNKIYWIVPDEAAEGRKVDEYIKNYVGGIGYASKDFAEGKAEGLSEWLGFKLTVEERDKK